MKPIFRVRQFDLFHTEAPPPSLPTEQQEKVRQLLQALLAETIVDNPRAEDGDEQDHL